MSLLSFTRRGIARLAAVSLLTLASVAPAWAALTVTPLTWNIVGLDSNNVAVGPNLFPIGFRVCAIGAPSNGVVTLTWQWTTVQALVNLRPGSVGDLSAPAPIPMTVGPLIAGACADAYFEIQVTRDAAAYDKTRRYQVTIADANPGNVVTPVREVYVERLISQNRNNIADIRVWSVASNPLGNNPPDASSTYSIAAGADYWIQLNGGTATQGYEQLATFVSFDNTIFKILDVRTTFDADSSPFVSTPTRSLYLDGCLWENDPASVSYRACLGTGKAGGDPVSVLYKVRIQSTSGTSERLNGLIYDFSGSSYHYNADNDTGGVDLVVTTPVASTLTKAFTPSTIAPNGISTLTLRINNPDPISNGPYSFRDVLPANVDIAATPNVITSGCGAPTVTAVATTDVVLLENATIAAGGSCTVSVQVTSATVGVYENTVLFGTSTTSANSYFMLGTAAAGVDTGGNASNTATLTVTNVPVTPLCSSAGNTIYARWEFSSGGSDTAPAVTTGAGLGFAADDQGNGSSPDTPFMDLALGSGVWDGRQISEATALNLGLDEYFGFRVSTPAPVNQVRLAFQALTVASGPTRADLYVSNAENALGTYVATLSIPVSATSQLAVPITSGINTGGNTFFRLYMYAAGSDTNGSPGRIELDNVTFTSCGNTAPSTPPTLAKAFVPNLTPTGGVSTLTFTASNPNASQLTGVTFSDTLPAGIVIAPTPNPVATGCGFTLPATNFAPVAGASTITLNGATIAASPATCVVSVDVVAATAGERLNVSGSISAAESGTNTGVGGSATAQLTTVAPPVLTKAFVPSIVAPGGTGSVTFTITNPNAVTSPVSSSLNGIAFVDQMPTTPAAIQITGAATTNTCGGTLTVDQNTDTVTLSGGGPLAPRAADPLNPNPLSTCTITVPISVPVGGVYTNTTGAVSHLVPTFASPQPGNTATAFLNSPIPRIDLLKQISLTENGPWSSGISIQAGTPVFYRFTVENTGLSPLTGISINDLTLAALTPQPPTLTLAACNTTLSAGGALPVADLVDQEHIRSCVVGPYTAGGSNFVNTATASSANPIVTSLPASAQYQITTQLPLLVADKIISAPNPLPPGGVQINTPLTYKIFVRNDGSGPTTSTVFVVDDLPVPLRFVGFAGTNWTCTPNDPLVCTYSGAALAPTQQTTDLFITVEATAVNPTIDNIARAVGGGDSTCPPPSFAARTAPSSCSDQVQFGSLPVTLSDVEVKVEAGQLRVDFGTASEAGSLAFNVYAARPGARSRQLLPGGTLAAAGTSFDRMPYQVVAPYDGQSEIWIEELSIKGVSSLYGPYAVGTRTGERVLSTPIDWAAIDREQNSFRTQQAQWLLSRIQASAQQIEVAVSQDGLVRIRHEDLLALGVDWTGQTAANVRLRSGSTGVPVRYEGPADFGPGSALSFFAESVKESRYTRTNRYRLMMTGESAANALPAIYARAGANTARVEVAHRHEHAPKLGYSISSPNSDPWYARRMTRVNSALTGYDETFEVPERSSASRNERLQIELHGGISYPEDPDHSVRIKLNGTEIAHARFDGISRNIVSVDLPDGLLNGGANTLRMELVGDTGTAADVVVLDKISVEYIRLLRAENDQLNFAASTTHASLTSMSDRIHADDFSTDGIAACAASVPECGTYRITGLTGSNVELYRRRANGSLQQLTGARISATGAGYELSFSALEAPGDRYWIQPANGSVVPTLAVKSAVTDPLVGAAADYLIISHPSFIAGLSPLIAARQADGLSVRVIDVEDVYAFYNRGVVDPDAIATAIADARQRLRTRYVLLVGGDTYDYFNYMGGNSRSFVPTNYRETGPFVRHAPVDSVFGDVNGDTLMDVAIGRFPVRTAAELDALIAKTLAYPLAGHAGKVVQLSDRTAYDVNFGAYLAALNDVLGPQTVTSALSLDAYPAGSAGVSQARSDLVSAVNGGQSLVAFLGHSAPTTWTFESLVTAAMVNDGLFSNASSPTVALVLGCYGSFFVAPSHNNVAPALMVQANGGGAAAVIGTSTLTSTAGDIAWMNALSPFLGTQRLGDALISAQRVLRDQGGEHSEVIISAMMLGDPALRLNRQ